MMELDIYYNLVLKDMVQFMTGLDTLWVIKVELHIVLITILQESELIHIILHFYEKLWLFITLL